MKPITELKILLCVLISIKQHAVFTTLHSFLLSTCYRVTFRLPCQLAYTQNNPLIFLPLTLAIYNSFCIVLLISLSCWFNPGKEVFPLQHLYSPLTDAGGPEEKAIPGSNFLHSILLLSICFPNKHLSRQRVKKDEFSTTLPMGCSLVRKTAVNK